jgi:hypothetical protein
VINSGHVTDRGPDCPAPRITPRTEHQVEPAEHERDYRRLPRN